MFYSLILLALCVLTAFRNLRAALVFGAGLLAAMAITALDPGYAHVYFFASYACIGVLAFFLADWRAGALVCLVAGVSAVHVFGFIDTLHRDIAGEVVFCLGLLAAAISGPSGGITDRVRIADNLHGHSIANRSAVRDCRHS